MYFKEVNSQDQRKARRDHFASMALQGILTGDPDGWLIRNTEPQVMSMAAKLAVDMGDALMKELDK